MPRLYLGAKKTISSFVAGISPSVPTQHNSEYSISGHQGFLLSVFVGFCFIQTILQHELNKRI